MITITKNIKAFGVDLTGMIIDPVIRYRRGEVRVDLMLYANQEALTEGLNNTFRLSGLPPSLSFPYDRKEHGVDILLYVSNKIKEFLITEIRSMEKYTDNGEVKEREVVMKEKFAEVSEITIDLASVKEDTKK